MRVFEVENEQSQVKHEMLHKKQELASVGDLRSLLQRAVHFLFVLKEDVGLLDVPVGVHELLDQQEADQHPGPEYKVEEKLVVVEADAGVDPVAVVVHFEHAPSALSAVMSALRFHDQTLRAEPAVKRLYRMFLRLRKSLKSLWSMFSSWRALFESRFRK